MPQDAQPPAQILAHLREAHAHVASGDLAPALLGCLRIRQLGIPFASKVIAFMNPEKAAIYDSVIARYLEASEHPEHEGLHMPVEHSYSQVALEARAIVYAKWCAYCRAKAAELNRGGHRWQDWDGTRNEWRAIDVEHALFAVGRGRPR